MNERNLTSLRSFLIGGFSDHVNEISISMKGNILDEMNILISRNTLSLIVLSLSLLPGTCVGLRNCFSCNPLIHIFLDRCNLSKLNTHKKKSHPHPTNAITKFMFALKVSILYRP